MSPYENSITVMQELFCRDYQFALATSYNNIPSIRTVDTYYDDCTFWVVTYCTSNKVKEIETNAKVALCHHLYSFSGEAFNEGHPLKPENQIIRDKLIQVFEPWYFAHNNENDKNMCYIKIKLTSGFVYKDGIGYKIDFVRKTANEFPFIPDVVIVT